MIRAVEILFVRVEGWAHEVGKEHRFTGEHLWHDVERFIHGAALTAPEHGGYDKCDVTIAFADGFVYRTRYDLVHASARGFVPLARHVAAEWTFYAGARIPSHMTEEQWRAYVDACEIRPGDWTVRCARYAIGDAATTAAEAVR